LRNELDTWKTLLQTPTPDQRTAVVSNLRYWQQDRDLASVRDPVALSRLDDERSAWQTLRADVASLTARASGANSPPALPNLPSDVFAR
jgi:hypothetical protein